MEQPPGLEEQRQEVDWRWEAPEIQQELASNLV
jgi:hypothetical protein